MIRGQIRVKKKYNKFQVQEDKDNQGLKDLYSLLLDLSDSKTLISINNDLEEEEIVFDIGYVDYQYKGGE